jgi:hypothetical protein
MQLVGESLTIERTGAATATVSYFVSKDQNTIIAGLPGRHRGLILTRLQSSQQEDGNYIATGTYEGQSEDAQNLAESGGGATYGDRPGATYEWSPTFEQTDIAKHPKIDALLKKYEGEQDAAGNIIWPETLSANSGKTGLSGSQGDAGTVNPMYGVTEFLSLGGVWSETALEQNIPPNLFSSIGEITEAPPGDINTPPNRFWLELPPMVSQHGDKWKVVRRWMLSGISSARDVEAARDIYSSSR